MTQDIQQCKDILRTFISLGSLSRVNSRESERERESDPKSLGSMHVRGDILHSRHIQCRQVSFAEPRHVTHGSLLSFRSEIPNRALLFLQTRRERVGPVNGAVTLIWKARRLNLHNGIIANVTLRGLDCVCACVRFASQVKRAARTSKAAGSGYRCTALRDYVTCALIRK